VKVNNILTMMGTGVVLGLTGGILIISSAALGLHAGVPALPEWACFLIIGVVSALIGGFLLSRSSAETSKKIEKVERKLTLQDAWNRKPWLMLGLSVAAGFVAQRILRSLFTADSVKVQVTENGCPAETLETGEQQEKEQKHSSLKAFLLKPINDLARHAASRAIALGTQMVVTPFLMRKLQEFIDQHQMNFAQQDQVPPQGHDVPPRDNFSSPLQTNGSRRF